jgi:hypothetical protein
MAPGDYMRIRGDVDAGTWYGQTPNNLLANLRGHRVVEHEDGTITAAPSIEVIGSFNEPGYWHGHLERGTWRSV